MEKTKQKKPIIVSKINYNERKQELSHITTETTETEIGKLVITSEGTFHNEGIRKVVKDLNERICGLQQAIKSQKEIIKETPEMTKELQELKDTLIKLQEIDKADKQKLQLEVNEESLKKAKKDLREIKDIIGTRLKL